MDSHNNFTAGGSAPPPPPPDPNSAGPSGDMSQLGAQGLLILQHINSLLQSTAAQQRLDMERLVDERLASRSAAHNDNHQHNGSHGGRDEHYDDHIPPPRSDRVSFKTFKGCGATEFSGTVDPIAACSWIDNVEKIFDISHCWEMDKVMYAAAMFTDLALDWWKSISASIGDDRMRMMTWVEFKHKFMSEYCPPDMQRKYEKEFFDLRQGSMSVSAYHAEFLKKSKFAATFIPTEEIKVRRFVEGLRWEIREIVQIRGATSIEKATEYAREREDAIIARDAELMPPPKRAHTDFQSRSFNSGSSATSVKSSPQSSYRQPFQTVRNQIY